MASAAPTLSLCSSLTAQCKISQRGRTLPLSNPNLTFVTLSSPSQKLSLSSAIHSSSSRLLYPAPLKASESEAPVLDAAELEAPKPEDAKIVEASAEEEEASLEKPAPKREEIFAVVMVCVPLRDFGGYPDESSLR